MEWPQFPGIAQGHGKSGGPFAGEQNRWRGAVEPVHFVARPRRSKTAANGPVVSSVDRKPMLKSW
jgi:hypothetical protein